jgi:hypothetical protein
MLRRGRFGRDSCRTREPRQRRSRGCSRQPKGRARRARGERREFRHLRNWSPRQPPWRRVRPGRRPASPWSREWSMCLPTARSAAACKRTTLSLPLTQQPPGADRRVAATETNGRGMCGDRRRPRSQMTKRKARIHATTALWPGRSGAGEGVGAGRRPAGVEIGDGRRRGPFCGL